MKPDLGSGRPDLGSERPYLRPEWSDLGSVRPDLESKRPYLGSKGLHLQFGRSVLRLRGEGGRTENGNRRKLPYVES